MGVTRARPMPDTFLCRLLSGYCCTYSLVWKSFSRWLLREQDSQKRSYLTDNVDWLRDMDAEKRSYLTEIPTGYEIRILTKEEHSKINPDSTNTNESEDLDMFGGVD